MVDFHSHALPGIDDGAADVVMSVAMLELSRKQGVDTVVLTPHYYFSHKEIDEFLSEREEAYNLLIEYAKEKNIEIPKLVKGAEVRYSHELIESEELNKLCIENTNYLLLEMPFSHWNPWIFDKIFKAASSKNINFIIAHAERYINGIKNIKKLIPLFNMDCTIQINSEAFSKIGKRRLVKELVLKDKVHLIGSDMHNSTTRKTTMNKAYKYIRRKYGEGLIKKISQYENNILSQGEDR